MTYSARYLVLAAFTMMVFCVCPYEAKAVENEQSDFPTFDDMVEDVLVSTPPTNRNNPVRDFSPRANARTDYTIWNDSGRTVRFRLSGGAVHALPPNERFSHYYAGGSKGKKITVLDTAKTYCLPGGNHKFWWMSKKGRVGFDANFRPCTRSSTRTDFEFWNASDVTVRFRLPDGRTYSLAPNERRSYYYIGDRSGKSIYVFNTGEKYALVRGVYEFCPMEDDGRIGFGENDRAGVGSNFVSPVNASSQIPGDDTAPSSALRGDGRKPTSAEIVANSGLMQEPCPPPAPMLLDGDTPFERNERSVPFLNSTVTGIKFYEAGMDVIPYGKRQYRETFDKSMTRCVWWELSLDHPEPHARQAFRIDVIWRAPDGRVTKGFLDTAMEANWPSSVYSRGFVGEWVQGVHRIDVFIKGQRVAGGTFEIVDSL